MLWRQVIGAAAVLGAVATSRLDAQAPITTAPHTVDTSWTAFGQHIIQTIQRDIRALLPKGLAQEPERRCLTIRVATWPRGELERKAWGAAPPRKAKPCRAKVTRLQVS